MAAILVTILLLFMPAVLSYDWTAAASGQLLNGDVVAACLGEDVALPWSYALNPGEHVHTIEWHYNPIGQPQADELLAIESSGNFLPVPGITQDLGRIEQAGLRIENIKASEEGVYTVTVGYDLHGESKRVSQTATVRIQPNNQSPTLDSHGLRAYYHHDAVYDAVSRDWHIRLTCEGFTSLGSPPISMVWRTPSGAVVPSTSQGNGTFTLVVPNPPQDGDYTCFPSNAFNNSNGCTTANFSGHASVHVSSYDSRFSIMDAQMRALQQQNADLLRTVQNLLASQPVTSGSGQGHVTDPHLVQEVRNLTNQNRDLSARLDSALQTNLQQAQQIQNLTAELDRLRSQQAGFSTDLALVQYMGGLPLRVGDRVVRGRDWVWGNQDGNPPGPGTVVATQYDADHPGWVKVQWDSGLTDTYRMGANGMYDLKLI